MKSKIGGLTELLNVVQYLLVTDCKNLKCDLSKRNIETLIW